MTQTPFVALPFQKLIPFWRDGVFCVCASMCVLNGLHESTLDFTVHDPWSLQFDFGSTKVKHVSQKLYIERIPFFDGRISRNRCGHIRRPRASHKIHVDKNPTANNFMNSLSFRENK